MTMNNSNNNNDDESFEDAEQFLSPTKTFSESENQSFRDAQSVLGTPASVSERSGVGSVFGTNKQMMMTNRRSTTATPVNINAVAAIADNQSLQNKPTPKGFTPRGEELTMSAFNEYAKLGEKQSRGVGTNTRRHDFDDDNADNYENFDVDDGNNNNRVKGGQELHSSLPSRLFSPSANEMNDRLSSLDDEDEDEEDDWGLSIPKQKKPHAAELEELSRSDWDDMLKNKNSAAARLEIDSFASKTTTNTNTNTNTNKMMLKTKTIVVAELVVRGWSKTEALFAIEKCGEIDVKKADDFLRRRM